MPRRIISQDPLILPSIPQKNFDSVVMSSFRSRTNEAGTQVRVILQPQEETSGEISSENPVIITVKDWDAQVAQAPKLQAAWDTLNDVMGLAYDFYRLRDKVTEAQANGEDATALIAARNVALTALREPVV